MRRCCSSVLWVDVSISKWGRKSEVSGKMNLHNQGKAQTPIPAQISPSLATTTLTKPAPTPFPSLVGQLPSKQKREQQKKGRKKIVVAVVAVTMVLLLLLLVGFVLTRKSAPDVTLYK